MKYKFLEHTADVMFEAYGSSLEELFENAALAVEEVMVKTADIRQEIKKELEFENGKIDLLLHDFLSELVYLKDAELLFFSRFEVKIEKDEKYKLNVTAYGDKLDAQKQELRDDAKAITLHKFEVKKEKDKWKARVIVDI